MFLHPEILFDRVKDGLFDRGFYLRKVSRDKGDAAFQFG